ncbi:response regulator [Knoellia aerolata]|uniref:LuxR family transcriptional regulator n=1 Tax=Knoellia aerolata DSM 18566 TaxID=1385519 RepID=A0A0A0JTP9_9MICO|nr:response regulator transcription factor [Knoellia aerolata]KGN40059.1 LuxR family transcriptional regulator [Knoellia aerolata DSM 18566]
MTSPVRVLIADDHGVFRKGLSALLESLPTATVVGEAADGAQAVQLAAQLAPDVVVMDLHMPSLGGVEATRRIVHANPTIGVLVLTMFEDDDSVFAAMRAGARGYLVKGSETEDVIAAVTAVGRGEAIFGPSVALRILSFLTKPLSAFDRQLFPELSNREREVLDLIASGVTNADIAKRLFLSPKTVRNHVSSVFTKLQVADRAQAILRAREAGLGRHADPR